MTFASHEPLQTALLRHLSECDEEGRKPHGAVDNDLYPDRAAKLSDGEWLKYKGDIYEPLLDFGVCPPHDHIVYGANQCAVLCTNAIAMWDIDGAPPHLSYEGCKRIDGDKLKSVVNELEAEGNVGSLAVYRTLNGFRVLSTKTLDPTGQVYLDAALRLGSDPRYSMITREQKCFRIRLTPKPWLEHRNNYLEAELGVCLPLQVATDFDVYAQQTLQFHHAATVSSSWSVLSSWTCDHGSLRERLYYCGCPDEVCEA